MRPLPLLDAEALGCVRQWKFSPALVGGQAVLTGVVVEVSFALR